MSEIRYFKLTNWKKMQRFYKKLGDGNPMPYFMVDPNIFWHPKLAKLTATSRMLYLNLMCEAARQNIPDSRVTVTQVELECGVSGGRVRVECSLTALIRLGVIIEETPNGLPLNRKEKKGGEQKAHGEQEKEPDHLPFTSGTGGRLILQTWNTSGMPMARHLSAKRRELLAAAWRDHPDLEYWRELFKKTSQNSFLTGNNDRKWRADLEWVLENHARISDGSYEGAPGKILREVNLLDD